METAKYTHAVYPGTMVARQGAETRIAECQGGSGAIFCRGQLVRTVDEEDSLNAIMEKVERVALKASGREGRLARR